MPLGSPHHSTEEGEEEEEEEEENSTQEQATAACLSSGHAVVLRASVPILWLTVLELLWEAPCCPAGPHGAPDLGRLLRPTQVLCKPELPAWGPVLEAASSQGGCYPIGAVGARVAVCGMRARMAAMLGPACARCAQWKDACQSIYSVRSKIRSVNKLGSSRVLQSILGRLAFCISSLKFLFLIYGLALSSQF